MGLCLWAIYTFYYTERITADIYKYFDDSAILFNSLKSHPIDFFKMISGIHDGTPEIIKYYDQMNFWQNDKDSSSHIIIRLNTLIRFFSLGYFNVHTVFLCFLSLIGLTAIYKTFSPLLQDKKSELTFVVFLIPSVLFWGSGVLKEGIILFAMGLLIYNIYHLKNSKSILVSLASILILAACKAYVLFALLPGLLLISWLNQSNNNKTGLKYIIILTMCLAIGLNIDKITPFENPLETLSNKQKDFIELANGTTLDANFKKVATPNSAININRIEPTILSVLKNSPQAIINCFFRPFLWEIKSPLMLIAGLENILLLIALIFSLIFIKPIATIPLKEIIFCLSFVFILFTIIGISTPIIGAIARYKVPALPFLMIGFLFIIDKNKVCKRLPFYSKIVK